MSEFGFLQKEFLLLLLQSNKTQTRNYLFMTKDVHIKRLIKMIPTVSRFLLNTEGRLTFFCKIQTKYNRNKAANESFNTIPTNTKTVLNSTSVTKQVNTNTTIHSPDLNKFLLYSFSLNRGGRVNKINLHRSALFSGFRQFETTSSVFLGC